MTGAHRHAEFAVRLEAANAWTVPRTRVHDHERAFFWIDDHSSRRLDPHQSVIHRPVEGPSVQHDLGIENEYVRYRLGLLLIVWITALPQHIPKQDRALPGVHPVLPGNLPGVLHHRGRRLGRPPIGYAGEVPG